MNIGEAKQEVKNTIRAYLQKDPAGQYCFPVIRQRPLLLMGPPGIGKTAIMAQIAEELGIGFVSYTMTHHTRQSAVGLPRIIDQNYGDALFSVTRYTMSEIIGSVYDVMERRDCKEGILFLDEINCVSDTLAPTMLQFLQNKTFGTHALPAGWVIAAAGNPPEYNRSVREFDIATLDRIRTIEIRPDTDVFLEYAASREMHGAVTAYLKLYPDRFYHASISEGKKYYVTARGWEDLSALLLSYEAMEIEVTEEIVSEFLCLPETCRGFFAFYRLYRKYGSDYRIPELLSGSDAGRAEMTQRIRQADFTERFAVVQMLLHGIGQAARRYIREDQLTVAVYTALRDCLAKSMSLTDCIAARRDAFSVKKKFGLLTDAEYRFEQTVLARLGALEAEIQQNRITAPEALSREAQQYLEQLLQARQNEIDNMHTALRSGITWLRDSMGRSQELTALMSGITADRAVMGFITRHGCSEFLEECGCLQTAAGEEKLRAACEAAQ